MNKFTQDVYNTLLQLSDDAGLVEGYSYLNLAILLGYPEEDKYAQRVSRAVEKLVSMGLIERAGRSGHWLRFIVKTKAKKETEPVYTVVEEVETTKDEVATVKDEVPYQDMLMELAKKADKFDRIVALIKEHILN